MTDYRHYARVFCSRGVQYCTRNNKPLIPKICGVITARIRRMGKVMFSVSLFVHQEKRRGTLWCLVSGLFWRKGVPNQVLGLCYPLPRSPLPRGQGSIASSPRQDQDRVTPSALSCPHLTPLPQNTTRTGVPLPIPFLSPVQDQDLLPPPPKQDMPQTGYIAGSTPLAVTQDFLVWIYFLY